VIAPIATLPPLRVDSGQFAIQLNGALFGVRRQPFEGCKSTAVTIPYLLSSNFYTIPTAS